jgi:hypothetical protein
LKGQVCGSRQPSGSDQRGHFAQTVMANHLLWRCPQQQRHHPPHPRSHGRSSRCRKRPFRKWVAPRGRSLVLLYSRWSADRTASGGWGWRCRDRRWHRLRTAASLPAVAPAVPQVKCKVSNHGSSASGCSLSHCPVACLGLPTVPLICDSTHLLVYSWMVTNQPYSC